MRILLEVESTKALSLLEVLRSLAFVKTRKLPDVKVTKSSGASLEKQYAMVRKESDDLLKDFSSLDGENWEDQY
jgi:hypothetical protein